MCGIEAKGSKPLLTEKQEGRGICFFLELISQNSFPDSKSEHSLQPTFRKLFHLGI